MRSKFAVLALISLAAAAQADACSTFVLSRGNELVFGRNYDFEIGDAIIFTNAKNVAKTSSVAGGAKWISKHGSVTFNQYGREFPTGGINERGLVVELMWLDVTRYPRADARPAVGVLEWIQYQLDTAASVAEVVANAGKVRIAGGAPLHYLVADRSGDAAAVEFLNGEAVIHRGASLEAPVLTNSTYAESCAFLRQFSGFGGRRALPQSPASLDRFARAAALVKRYDGKSPIVDYAFETLDAVAQRGYTRWSIVYDLRAMKVHYRTDVNRRRRHFDLAAFSFGCSAPPRMLDANSSDAGDVSRAFGAFDAGANERLVERSYATVSFLRSVPREEVRGAAAHWASSRCVR